MAVVARRSRFARPERERRFLAPPDAVPRGAVSREIHDRCIAATRLRLRRVVHPGGDVELKLTQKVPGDPWGELTTTYLSPAEYEVLRALPAATLVKTRHRPEPVQSVHDGIVYDVFHGPLSGLVLAEVEFDDDRAARAYTPPQGLVEVTRDPRFTGGRLASADSEAVLDAARGILALSR